MPNLLDRINEPNDIRKIRPEDYPALAKEIRELILKTVSSNGGHLASNLGVVELTMALHLSMNFPNDRLVWDVGHQSYTHKILTGRKKDFASLRTFGGISGFPRRSESPCDCFGAGHSSTSISAALGMARARDLLKENRTIAAVIGDGSLTGGMAYEALNNLSRLKSNMIVVVNDNHMSISENVGGLSTHFAMLRTRESYLEFKKDVERTLRQIPRIGGSLARSVKYSKDQFRQLFVRGGIFEDFGIKYIGPVDGHDVRSMVRIFNAIKLMDEPVIVHVVTQKGRGYAPAEKDPSLFHGIGKFDLETGIPEKSSGESWTDVFSKKIVGMAREHHDITAATAAMPDGTGLHRFAERFPRRFFDVGIAEQHAVTFAAGLAAGGLRPFVAVYSSFFQRAYDQIIHDVCIQKLPVVFCVDRAGLVGADGETHQGIFDLSFMSGIPDMVVMAPKNSFELTAMLEYAYELECPVSLRYGRGAAYNGLEQMQAPLERGKSELIRQGDQVMFFALGSMVECAVQAADLLARRGISAGVVNARFAKPIDEEALGLAADQGKLIVTMEENLLAGGYGEAAADYLALHHPGARIMHVGIEDRFVPHGSVDQLRKMLGIDPQSVAERTAAFLENAEDGGQQ